VIRKKGTSSTSPRLIILMLGLSISVLYLFSSITQSFSERNESVDISVVNSSFVPLTNTEANQVKVNVEYSLEDEQMQNQLVNAVMEVYAANGTLIRTTSIPSGFTLNSDGGVELLRTTFNDKSLQSVSVNIVVTDLTKKIPLSNKITENLDLEDSLTKRDSAINKE